MEFRTGSRHRPTIRRRPVERADYARALGGDSERSDATSSAGAPIRPRITCQRIKGQNQQLLNH